MFEGGISVDELNGGIRKDLPPATNTDSGGRGVDSDSGIGASNVTSTDRLTPFSDMTMFSGGGGGASTTLLTPDKGIAQFGGLLGSNMTVCACAYICVCPCVFIHDHAYVCACVCMCLCINAWLGGEEGADLRMMSLKQPLSHSTML